IAATIENADRDARALSSKQTWKMAQDALLTGWGAGSFRYVFPIYQKEIPELFYVRYHKKRGWEGRRFYRYAHNDILQFLAEYGMIGCSLLLLTIISLLLPALKAILHAPCAILYLLVGLLAAASHAFLEFIFHSPAYWVVLLGGLALASRLMVLQHQAERLR
ncbi:MAG: O-antigen ligase family protein, partial [Opitutales bacterium]